MDSDLLAGFRALLDPVNALADAAPGFVWRLQTEAGNATSLRIFGADDQLVNMSVWSSAEALWEFVYAADHLAVMRRRREWFERMPMGPLSGFSRERSRCRWESYMCLWWVPAGHLPRISEAEERLTHLREHGPTPHAFTFKTRVDAPGSVPPELVIFDCDGVLVDSEPATCEVMAELITELGLPKSAADCEREYVGQWWPDSEARIAAELGRPLPPGFEAEYRRRQDAALSAGVDPIPGVVAAVDRVEADGLATCVASNGPHEKMAITLGGAGLAERFEGRIFSSADVAAGKPAPDLFRHAAAGMEVRPEACVVVEDSPLGALGASRAGMPVLGFRGHAGAGALAAAGAIPFERMDEVPGLIRALGQTAPIAH